MIGFILEWTGITPIIFFLFQILLKMKEEGVSINILLSVLLVNAANAIATLGGGCIVNKFGQRNALFGGLFVIVLCWIGVIVSNILEASYVCLVFLMAFVIVF